MRTLVALLLLPALLITVAAQKPATLDEREAKKLIEEYVAAATSDARRGEIVARLKTGAPTLCQKTLKPMLGDEAKRPYALDVAIAIKVPGLWNDAKKHIDTTDEERVVKLGLVCSDKGASDFLFERWKVAASDSASHGFLQNGFETCPVALETIKKFKDVLKGERATEAARVVKFQLGANVDDAATLLSNWDTLEKAYKSDAQVFAIKGTDLFPNPKTHGEICRVGWNYRLSKDAIMMCAFPDEFETGNFTITVRVRVPSGDGAKVSPSFGRGAWTLVYKKGEWTANTGTSAQYAVPAKIGEWTTITFAVRDKSTDNMRLVREADIKVGNAILVSPAAFNGELRSLDFVGGDSGLVIAGAEIGR